MARNGMCAIVLTYPLVFGPADVTNPATATTKWVPCRGARMVVFNWLSTGGINLTSQGVEGSNALPLVTGGAGYSAGNSQVATSTNSTTVNQFGGLRQVVVPLNPTNATNAYIVVEGLHAIATPAVGTINGLQCTAYVYYDDESMIPPVALGQVQGPV